MHQTLLNSGYSFLNQDNTILGEGSCGKVKLVQNSNNEIFAIKIIEKQTISSNQLTENIKSEVKIQKNAQHQNIIRLFNYFEDKQNVYLILEYAQKGSLKNVLYSKEKRPTQEQLFKYFSQTCEAIQYLHVQKIIHRDLKPENILLDANDQIKVCDFGHSTDLKKQRNTFCGTIEYMAPEIILQQYYDESVDVWSLGVLLYELYNRRLPFQGQNIYQQMHNITQSNNIKYKEELDKDLVDLLQRMLCKQKENRIKLADVMKHSWFVKNQQNNATPTQKKNNKQNTHFRANSDQVIGNSNKQIKQNNTSNFQVQFVKNPLLCHKYIDIKLLRMKKDMQIQAGLLDKILIAFGCVNRERQY